MIKTYIFVSVPHMRDYLGLSSHYLDVRPYHASDVKYRKPIFLFDVFGRLKKLRHLSQ